MPARPCKNPVTAEALVRFGKTVRAARRRAGVSQQRLEDLSGVDQTSISRLELGRSPRFPMEGLVRLQMALRSFLPLGLCPHEHVCAWQPPGTQHRYVPAPLPDLKDDTAEPELTEQPALDLPPLPVLDWFD